MQVVDPSVDNANFDAFARVSLSMQLIHTGHDMCRKGVDRNFRIVLARRLVKVSGFWSRVEVNWLDRLDVRYLCEGLEVFIGVDSDCCTDEDPVGVVFGNEVPAGSVLV